MTETDIRVGSSTDGLTPLSVAERSLAAGAWQWAGLGVVAIAAIVADQVTKHIVTATLGLDDSVHVVGPLSIHHVQNSGIAFGLFASATVVVTVVTAGAVVWMLVFFARSGARHPVLPAALGLLIGGSVSNLVDRIRLHHVTDFIDFKWWPAFNLADSFIVVGVAILLGALVAADRAPTPATTHARRRGAVTTIVAPAEAAGERLDRFLATRLGSRSAAERAVSAGALVDGVARAKSHRLEGGEQIVLAEIDDRVTPIDVAPPRIVVEDEHLLVVDKPAGLVVHPGAGHASGTLVDALAGQIAGGDPERPGIVHRLDRDTSGLTGRGPLGGRPRAPAAARPRPSDRADLPRPRAGKPALTHRHRSRRRSAATAATRRESRSRRTRPKDAVTHFEVLERFPEHALLRVRLETGRMHQIRVHLAAIELPVVGDRTYGVAEPMLGRQFLHASELAFPHPFTDVRVEARSELPVELERYLATMGS